MDLTTGCNPELLQWRREMLNVWISYNRYRNYAAVQKEAAIPSPPSQHPLMPNCFQISNNHWETNAHSSVNSGTRRIIKIQKVSEKFTFGEHLKCMPGTGSVVTYIVIHRYRYSVPTIQKNLLLIIDLEEEKKENTISKGKRNTQGRNFGLLDTFDTQDLPIYVSFHLGILTSFTNIPMLCRSETCKRLN